MVLCASWHTLKNLKKTNQTFGNRNDVFQVPTRMPCKLHLQPPSPSLGSGIPCLPQATQSRHAQHTRVAQQQPTHCCQHVPWLPSCCYNKTAQPQNLPESRFIVDLWLRRGGSPPSLWQGRVAASTRDNRTSWELTSWNADGKCESGPGL